MFWKKPLDSWYLGRDSGSIFPECLIRRIRTGSQVAESPAGMCHARTVLYGSIKAGRKELRLYPYILVSTDTQFSWNCVWYKEANIKHVSF
jgi:hypothetical protein